MADIDNKYIVACGWMNNIGCSNILERDAYALVYGFSQDGESEFKGSVNYICEWLMCSRPTAVKTMRSLESKGLVIKRQENISGVVFNRYTAVVPKDFLQVVKNINWGSKESLPNNTNINTIKENNKDKSLLKKEKFIPPVLEEVKSYCDERNNGIDPQMFIDFYQQKGWMIGKNKMKDWKAAVRTWEANRKQTQDYGRRTINRTSVEQQQVQHRTPDYTERF